MVRRWYRTLARPVRFDYLLPLMPPESRPVILDVGCGNHSASITRQILPRSVYHGVDLDSHYNNDESDSGCMDRFFALDLDRSDLCEIESGCYDVVIVSHVIEHLHRGSEVLGLLTEKLKPGGLIYVETPHTRSTGLPSMKGSLNFHDDHTHIRIYPVAEIVGVLEAGRCEILRAGTRRSLKRIALTPLHCVNSLVRDGYISGSAFWDVLGFASVVIARKVPGHQGTGQ